MKTLNTVHHIGETRNPLLELWSAVLYTAIDDAFNQVRIAEARHALAWLKGCGEDFRLVCEYANRDPEYVHRKLIKKLKKREEYLNGFKARSSPYNNLFPVPGKWLHKTKTNYTTSVELSD
tara:strand:+ start:161 stop:523 length:363 start_codon:yes stop_codon:yes gene_type:complete